MIKRFVERFTGASLVGVDVGSAFVKVVEIGFYKGEPVLRRAVVREAEGGEPVLSLKRAMEEGDFKTNQVALGLASPELVVRSFRFPRMPKKEMAGALRIEAEQTILNGHPMSGMAVDWHELGPASGDSVRGLLAVAPKKLFSAELETVKAAGLVPTVMDAKTLALWNAYWVLVGSKAPQPETILLINLGARTTNLVIVKGPDELMLARDIELGAVSPPPATPELWISELRDSVRYARSKGGLRTLDGVCVTGGGTASWETKKRLESEFGAPVTEWNALDRIAWDSKQTRLEKSLGRLLAVAVGLAMRSSG